MAFCVFAPMIVRADYKQEIGFLRMQDQLGTNTPDGTGVDVVQVEAPIFSAYLPDTNHVDFTGKNIVDSSGNSLGASGHATDVARYFYGLSGSVASSITQVAVYDGNHWLGNGFLNAGANQPDPLVETRKIQNHSWVGYDGAYTTNAIQRLDYAIFTNGFSAVVALDNGTGTVPAMLAHAYNVITVGRSDGQHSRGGTRFDGVGRNKPDLVAPLDEESWSTPVVASSAALLIQSAGQLPGAGAAVHPVCIKALLMAGATKNEFTNWTHSAAHPLDSVFGAGELNVWNSYSILAGGDHLPSSTNLVPSPSWHWGALSGAQTSTWFFAIGEKSVGVPFSAVLAWNRKIYDADPNPNVFSPQPDLADLNLRLCAATGFVVGATLEISTSAVDNVELIYRPVLEPGRYALQVFSSGNTSDYALAWFSATVPIPRMERIDVGEMTNATLDIQAASGHVWVIQSSSNLLSSWSDWTTNADSTGSFTSVDSDIILSTSRFYRVRLEPWH